MHCFGIHIPYPVVTFVFTVLRHELLGRILSHAQACDNVRVPSATQCTASVHIQHFTHAQTCDNVRVPSVKQCTASILSHAQTCDNVRLFKCYPTHYFGTFVIHMLKPVIAFLFKVLRKALLCYILYKPISCDNVPVQSAQQCIASVHTQYFTHAQTCDNVRVQSATQCTVSVNIIYLTRAQTCCLCAFLGQIFFASAVLRTSASIILLWHRKGTQRPSQSITFDQTHWGRDVSHVGLAGQKCLVLSLCVCRIG